jgi:pyruvate formate lyase activating enzyme
MKIGGLQKLTLVDYPNKIAATVFLTGCNFKCGFCHNPSLVNPGKNENQISELEFFNFLKSKQGLVDGICITGGEPTINSDLPKFIQKIKKLNFAIKLDTNGNNPKILQKLIDKKLLSFVAMDIKTSLDKYEKATNTKINLENIKESVEIIKNSKIDYEFRTTVVPGIVDREDIEKIGKWLKGTKKYVLQQFRNQKVLNKEFEKVVPYWDDTLKEFKKILEKYIKNVELRI